MNYSPNFSMFGQRVYVLLKNRIMNDLPEKIEFMRCRACALGVSLTFSHRPSVASHLSLHLFEPFQYSLCTEPQKNLTTWQVNGVQELPPDFL